MKTKYLFFSLILFFGISANAQNLENANSNLFASFTITANEVQSSYLDENSGLGDSSNHIMEVILKEYDLTKEKNDTKPTGLRSNHFMVGALLGLPIGQEADFYGLTYSIFTAYLFVVSQKLSIGPSVWYTHYTGKETDFGFKTEGESFIPLMLLAVYNLTKAFGVEAGLGYSISASEGGEGGFTYSAGPFWRPLEAVVIALNYVNISFGEGSLGAVMLGGRFSLSKK